MAEAELVREILEEGPSGYRRPKRPYRRIKAKRFVGWFARGFLFWLLLSAGMLWLVVGQEGYLLRDVKGLMAQRHADQAAPSPSTADLAVVRRLAMNPMGINTFLYQEVEEEKIRRTLQMIKDAGFGFVREQVAWQEFERGQKNSYWDERWQRSSWHNLDRLIDLVEEYGLQFMARVDYPPDWSMPPGTTWHATPPVNYEDYGDFVYTLAERYRGRIAYYQIWNEPNLTIEWGRQNVDAAAYVRLLKTGYARIKQADPGAYVIAAALAPTIEAGPANLSDLTYLRRMYEAGAKGHFDAIAVNPYGLRSGPEERSQSQTDVNFSRPLRAREIMVEFGDEATPIWAAETGWNTLPPSFPQRPAYGRVTGERQAEYTVQAGWYGVVALPHGGCADGHPAVILLRSGGRRLRADPSLARSVTAGECGTCALPGRTPGIRARHQIRRWMERANHRSRWCGRGTQDERFRGRIAAAFLRQRHLPER